jgi:hypothetical protein
MAFYYVGDRSGVGCCVETVNLPIHLVGDSKEESLFATCVRNEEMSHVDEIHSVSKSIRGWGSLTGNIA